MSRTTRNRNTVPVGWTVRDNGLPYLNGNDLYGNSVFDATGHNPQPRYRRSWYRCETTGPRREFNRQYRAKTKHLVRIGKFDDLRPPRRTSGWLSW